MNAYKAGKDGHLMIYADFCRHYHSATGVHTALLDGKESIYSSLGEALQVETRGTWPVYFSEQNPAFCSIPPHTLYGIVRIDGTDQSVVLGPVYNIAVSDALLDQLLDVLRLPKEMKKSSFPCNKRNTPHEQPAAGPALVFDSLSVES